MPKTGKFALILPAAGSGNRFGAGDKLLADLGGQSVLQRSVALFARRAEVGPILIVTAPDRFDVYREHLGQNRASRVPVSRLHFVAGGRERWESVLFGLRHLADLAKMTEFVAIHDAARPLCPAEVIDAALEGAARHGGALPGLPEPATLKRRDADGTIQRTVDRRDLYQAQTPQCFAFKHLWAGYERLLKKSRVADLTDDAQVFERIGRPVVITAGSPTNLKITTAEDLRLARALVRA